MIGEKLEVPDVIEPIYGFRCWQKIVGNEYLRSWHNSYTWRTGRNTAECIYTQQDNPHYPDWDKIPGVGCRCGFYSFNLDNRFQDMWLSDNSPCGIVELTARVVIHQTGYRAEKAKVAAVFDVPWCDMKRVAETYQVPLISAPKMIEAIGMGRGVRNHDLPQDELARLGFIKAVEPLEA